MPTTRTASAFATTALLTSPNMWPSWPLNSGWRPSKHISDSSTPHTSAPSSSATRVSSSWAPEAATPSPISTSGASAPPSSDAAEPISSWTGVTAVCGSVDGRTGSSLGWSSTSSGRETKTGPRGGVMAILTARRSTRSTDEGSVTRVAYLVTGRAMATRSAAIWPSIAS